MSFFKTFYRSLFDFTWLRDHKQNTKPAAGYALLFIFITTILYVLPIVREVKPLIVQLIKTVEEQVPEFTAYVKGGELSVDGITVPYTFETKTEDGAAFKIVVNTETTTTPELATFVGEGPSNGLFFSKTALTIYQGGDGVDKTQTVSFKDVSDTNFSKADVMSVLNKFRGAGLYILAAFVIVFFFVGVVIWKLLQLFVISLFILMISAIAKRGWFLKEIFTVGLFALTLPTLINITLLWLGRPIPFLYTAVSLFLMLGAMFYQESGGETKSVEPSSAP